MGLEPDHMIVALPMLRDILIPALFGLTAGLLIGCVGIGGVILVPLLSNVGGIDAHTAIASAMFAYLISGAMGTIVYAQQGSIRWDLTLRWLWAPCPPLLLEPCWQAALPQMGWSYVLPY